MKHNKNLPVQCEVVPVHAELSHACRHTHTHTQPPTLLLVLTQVLWYSRCSWSSAKFVLALFSCCVWRPLGVSLRENKCSAPALPHLDVHSLCSLNLTMDGRLYKQHSWSLCQLQTHATPSSLESMAHVCVCVNCCLTFTL